MISPQTINEVRDRLIKTYHPLEIYIFGSYAWGHPDKESDLDLMVIVGSTPENRYKALSEGHRALSGLELSKDILLMSKAEFEESSSRKSNICYRIKNEGKKIYEA